MTPTCLKPYNVLYNQTNVEKTTATLQTGLSNNNLIIVDPIKLDPKLLPHGACKDCVPPFTNLELFFDRWEENWTQRTICPLCGYFTYGKKQTFKEHLDGHNGQDLYMCLLCRATTSKWDNMSIHLNTEHASDVKKREQLLFKKYIISNKWQIMVDIRYCEHRKHIVAPTGGYISK